MPTPTTALQGYSSLLTTALVASLLSTVQATSAHTDHRPNIVFILLDDAGMADFQSTNPLMRTPNILQLLEEGLFLNQSYVFPSCTPTRSAILTGRYPHTFGEQNLRAGTKTAKFWLNKTLTTLPKEMKALGYVTHMLGQWHLHEAFCHPGLTPMSQGFDTFYGTLNKRPFSDYYHQTILGGYFDWWDGHTPDLSANGTYATDLIFDRMVRIVEESPMEKPFFAFTVLSTPHLPLEVPQRYIDRYCSHVAHEPRQTYCGEIAAVDEGIGRMITALKEKGIYNNTAFIVMSDNGGATKNYSSNFPLRSGKWSLYEGGTRSYTVVKAPGLAETGTTWPGIIHAVDWLPTLVGMAGGKGSKDPKNKVHGMDLWNEIKYFGASARKEFLYAYDDSFFQYNSGYRLGDWKLIKGKPGYLRLGWYPPYDLIASGKAKWEDLPHLQNYDGHYELYNINSDPYERHDLASKRPDKVDEINARMEAFLKDHPLQPLRLYFPETPWTYPQVAKRSSLTCRCQPDKMCACSRYILL